MISSASSTFKALNFEYEIQSFSRISQAPYELSQNDLQNITAYTQTNNVTLISTAAGLLCHVWLCKYSQYWNRCRDCGQHRQLFLQKMNSQRQCKFGVNEIFQVSINIQLQLNKITRIL